MVDRRVQRARKGQHWDMRAFFTCVKMQGFSPLCEL